MKDDVLKKAIWGFVVWIILVLFIVNYDLFPSYDTNVLMGIAIALLFVMISAISIVDE